MTSRSAGDFGRQPGEAGDLPQPAISFPVHPIEVQWRQVEPARTAGKSSDDAWAARLKAGRDDNGEGADTVAGSEFVDDRIRLRD